jgi:hypothetical protein
VQQLQEQTLIRNVKAEQFLLSMVADRVAVADAYAYIAGRLQSLEMAGLAPGGLTLGRAGQRNLAAGAGPYRPGVWFNANRAWLKDRRVGAGVEGGQNSVAIGADLTGETLTLGGYLSYSDLGMDGSNAAFDSQGWGGGLYARWAPAPQFRLTASVGKGKQDVKFDRTSAGLRSFGKADRDQLFGSVAVDSQLALGGGLVAVPAASLLFSNSETESYVDTSGRFFEGFDTDLMLGSAGGAIYYTGGPVMPFLQLAVNHQFNRQAGVDRTYGQVGGGVVAPIRRGTSLLVGAQTLVWKRGERETRVALTLRQSF